jgi:hypothetical protein
MVTARRGPGEVPAARPRNAPMTKYSSSAMPKYMPQIVFMFSTSNCMYIYIKDLNKTLMLYNHTLFASNLLLLSLLVKREEGLLCLDFRKHKYPNHADKGGQPYD